MISDSDFWDSLALRKLDNKKFFNFSLLIVIVFTLKCLLILISSNNNKRNNKRKFFHSFRPCSKKFFMVVFRLYCGIKPKKLLFFLFYIFEWISFILFLFLHTQINFHIIQNSDYLINIETNPNYIIKSSYFFSTFFPLILFLIYNYKYWTNNNRW